MKFQSLSALAALGAFAYAQNNAVEGGPGDQPEEPSTVTSTKCFTSRGPTSVNPVPTNTATHHYASVKVVTVRVIPTQTISPDTGEQSFGACEEIPKQC